MLAAAWCLYRFVQLGRRRAACLDVHHMAIDRTACGDRGIFHHFDQLRHAHALRIGDFLLGELVDKDVAVEQQGRDAIGQIQLR